VSIQRLFVFVCSKLPEIFSGSIFTDTLSWKNSGQSGGSVLVYIFVYTFPFMTDQVPSCGIVLSWTDRNNPRSHRLYISFRRYWLSDFHTTTTANYEL